MNCEQVLEDIDLCALGTLEPAEAERINTHAATCDRCRAALLAAEETVARLALVAPRARAPQAMRAAVLEAGGQPPSSAPAPARAHSVRRLIRGGRVSARHGALVAAVVALPLVGALVWAAMLQHQVNDLRHDTADMQRRNDGLVLFAVPSSIKADFRPTAENVSASGAASWNPERGVCFMLFDRLPPLDAGTVYRLWYTIDNDRVIDAGQLTPDEDGRADIAVDTSRWRGRVYDMVLKAERRPHDPNAPTLLTAELRRPD